MSITSKSFNVPKKDLILRNLVQKTSQALLMLDVSDIYLLKTITETGSINKSAELLCMSQPTLSKRVSRLEQVLRVELFHRQSTGMKPTSIAEYLIENGKQIQSKLDAMCRHVELLSALEGGTLHIGVSPVIEQLYFPKVLLDFVEETKDIEISFEVDRPETLKQRVLDGEIDIAVGPFDAGEISDDLVISEFKREEVITVVRPGHPLLNTPTPIAYKSLLDYQGIGPKMDNSMVQYLEEQGVSVLVKITCDNYRICKSVAMMSDYFTGGPSQLFKNELASGDLVSLQMDRPVVWHAFSLTRPESVHTPTVKKFLEILHGYAAY